MNYSNPYNITNPLYAMHQQALLDDNIHHVIHGDPSGAWVVVVFVVIFCIAAAAHVWKSTGGFR